jgi:hypothetical protein
VTIQEQTQAVKDSTFTYRKLATDIITGAQQRATGLIGAGSSIFGSLNNAVAGSGTAGIAAAQQAIQTVLASGAGQIAANVYQALRTENYGGGAEGALKQLTDAFTAGPSSFASALIELGPILSQLESTMGDAQKESFDALIQSMIDNTTATVDNNNSLAQLNSALTSNAQGFSTTAWQTFRQAIFNGSGGLLPQYNIPQMATGGHIMKGGLFELHAGEKVTPASMAQAPTVGNMEVNITSPTEVLDEGLVGTKIAWHLAGSGRL